MNVRDGSYRSMKRGRFVAKFLAALRDVCRNLCGVRWKCGKAQIESPIREESPLAEIALPRVLGQPVFNISAQRFHILFKFMATTYLSAQKCAGQGQSTKYK